MVVYSQSSISLWLFLGGMNLAFKSMHFCIRPRLVTRFVQKPPTILIGVMTSCVNMG